MNPAAMKSPLAVSSCDLLRAWFVDRRAWSIRVRQSARPKLRPQQDGAHGVNAEHPSFKAELRVPSHIIEVILSSQSAIRRRRNALRLCLPQIVAVCFRADVRRYLLQQNARRIPQS
jgi:hypothetical protein